MWPSPSNNRHKDSSIFRGDRLDNALLAPPRPVAADPTSMPMSSVRCRGFGTEHFSPLVPFFFVGEMGSKEKNWGRFFGGEKIGV